MIKKTLSISLVIILLLTSCLSMGCNRSDNTGVSSSDISSSVQPDDETTTGSDSSATLGYSADGTEYLVTGVDTSNYKAITNSDNERVFYEIFVGSFSDSNGDGVGDLRGIINRMDYLNDGDPFSGQSLGIEGIWLSPIFESPSYHKYDTTDYYTIDPDFGTMDDLKELVSLCHERGVKVILDFVINHTGSQNQWFGDFCTAHRQGDTESPYYDFYTYSSDGPKAGRAFSRISSTDDYYECNFSGDMPELNYDNEEVYNTVLDIAHYYLTDIGVDGFRFDAAKYIYFGEESRNVEFWKRFMADLKAINPDIYTVGEVWSGDSVIEMYAPALNCFNFSMSQSEGKIADTTKHGDAGVYAKYIESCLAKLDPDRSDSMFISFISNHDMDRAAGYMTVASGYAKMAANLYILTPGSPFIYYGEEIGLKGSRGSANTDANRRLAMLWGDGDTVSDPEGTTFEAKKQTNGTVTELLLDDDGLLNYYKRLIMIRKANPEIASGEFLSLRFGDTFIGGFISVGDDGSAVMVLHNTTGKAGTVDLGSGKLTNGKSVSDYIDLDCAEIKEVLEACFLLEGNSTELQGHILTLDEQTSVVIR